MAGRPLPRVAAFVKTPLIFWPQGLPDDSCLRHLANTGSPPQNALLPSDLAVGRNNAALLQVAATIYGVAAFVKTPLISWPQGLPDDS